MSPPSPAAAAAAAAVSNRQTQKSRKRKAAEAASRDVAGPTEPTCATTAAGDAEAAEAAAAAAAAGDADSKYKDSQLLAFGQQLADQVLAHVRSIEVSAGAAADSPSSLAVTAVMQLMQPIVDRMLQENAYVLGEPITAEYKAYIADIGRKGGSSSSSGGGEGDAAGVLRYQHMEQVGASVLQCKLLRQAMH
jgi:hypothetical protein